MTLVTCPDPPEVQFYRCESPPIPPRISRLGLEVLSLLVAVLRQHENPKAEKSEIPNSKYETRPIGFRISCFGFRSTFRPETRPRFVKRGRKKVASVRDDSRNPKFQIRNSSTRISDFVLRISLGHRSYAPRVEAESIASAGIGHASLVFPRACFTSGGLMPSSAPNWENVGCPRGPLAPGARVVAKKP